MSTIFPEREFPWLARKRQLPLSLLDIARKKDIDSQAGTSGLSVLPVTHLKVLKGNTPSFLALWREARYASALSLCWCYPKRIGMCERKRSPLGKLFLNNQNWIPEGQSGCLLSAKCKVPSRHEKLWPKPLVQWLQIMTLVKTCLGQQW